MSSITHGCGGGRRQAQFYLCKSSKFLSLGNLLIKKGISVWAVRTFVACIWVAITAHLLCGCSLSAGCYVKGFTSRYPLQPTKQPWRVSAPLPRWVTEAQRRYINCLRSHGWDLNPALVNSCFLTPELNVYHMVYKIHSIEKYMLRANMCWTILGDKDWVANKVDPAFTLACVRIWYSREFKGQRVVLSDRIP